MKPRRNHCRRQTPNRPELPGRGQDGFTLLEVMVVVFVMGILAAWAVSSWASFMRHQELRGDAINLHKEILALKARAVQNDDTAYIDAVLGGSALTLKWKYETNANPPMSDWSNRVIQLKNDVKIDTAVGSLSGGDLVKLPGNSFPVDNKWRGPNCVALSNTDPKSIRIFIHPDTLRVNSFNAFENGRITLISNVNKVKSRYCIQKDSTCMKPEIYHQTEAGAVWKRL
jgi:prepilin-type N-terminal cleavage/methylation domain-containing protein